MITPMSPLRDSDGDGDLSSSQCTSLSSSFARSSSLSRSSYDAYALPDAKLSYASPTSRSPVVSSYSRKPHRSSSDPSWAAILRRGAPLGPQDFHLVGRIGSGDVGTVYLCHLRDDVEGELDIGRQARNPLLYAMKVVDKREMEKKKKLGRAETERRILRSLDHPFLPTLYADFDAAHYSCVVMEFCPSGDLHSLRHRQPERRFSPAAVRFYAAEVLLALEYLHLLGIVYRDLKPENVLIRPDGHIMLSDFDLSFESTASPILDNEDDVDHEDAPSCLPLRLFSFKKKQQASKSKLGFLRRCSSLGATFGRPRLVAEPVEARSMSFVGTHEYVAPEVVNGKGHGSGVDWWAYGIFVYELLHGRTPFAGPDNKATLCNIVRQSLTFPPTNELDGAGGSSDRRVRDLIGRLLAKDPHRRMGSARGAADVKEHPFFSGVNFALLRSERPPVVPPSEGGDRRKEPPRFDYF